jgi:hypothetical protein
MNTYIVTVRDVDGFKFNCPVSLTIDWGSDEYQQVTTYLYSIEGSEIISEIVNIVPVKDFTQGVVR